MTLKKIVGKSYRVGRENMEQIFFTEDELIQLFDLIGKEFSGTEDKSFYDPLHEGD